MRSTDDELGVITKISDAFKKSEIDYLIIGGIASVLHGVERATFDLDIAIPANQEVLAKVIGLVKKIGYRTVHDCKTKDFIKAIDDLTPQYILKRKCVHLRDRENKLFPLDLVPIDHGVLLSMKDDAITLPINKSTIFIASIEQLIKWKQEVGRPKDLQDIAELKKILKKLPKRYYD